MYGAQRLLDTYLPSSEVYVYQLISLSLWQRIFESQYLFW